MVVCGHLDLSSEFPEHLILGVGICGHLSVDACGHLGEGMDV